jgi:long-chain acyl-CoA synthetase
VEKIWLNSYPSGIPAEIDVNKYKSLADVFYQNATKYRDHIAYVNLGKSMTYGELEQKSRDFAAYLTQAAGMKKGDRIAIMMPNLLQYPVVLFAALRAGLVVVNTNPMYTERELKHQLNDAGVSSIVILQNFAHTLGKVLEHTPIKTVITTQVGDLLGFPKSLVTNMVLKYVKKIIPSFHLPTAISFNRVLAKGHKLGFSEVAIIHDDIAFLQYTGGTTGVAKGASLTHKNIVANLLQAHAWSSVDLEEGKEVFIAALPLYHIFSLTASAMFALEMGAKIVLITNPRDLPTFVQTLQNEKFSFIIGVNTLFNALLNTQDFDKLDFSSLKLTLGGGMAVTQATAERWQQVTGKVLIEAYGLTETSPAVCINPVRNERYTANIGLPIPSTEISIRDEEGNEVAMGERGELWVRGPQVMKGYWHRPEETAHVFDNHGYLSTGDVAIINEQGYVKLVDRIKDMILVSGFNVYPNEVEDVVSSHKKVLEVGAIGISHKVSGERVKIYVVKKDDSLTKKELISWCRQGLTGYKRPRVIEFINELPKSNVGKILRRELRVIHDKTHSKPVKTP